MSWDFEKARRRMVERDLIGRGIGNETVLAAMGKVARHDFVPEDMQTSAYEDAPLPIGEGQTISQPYVVAYMIEASGLAPGERALEIGTGSGYAAAVMCEIADEVYTVERHKPLADAARARLQRLGHENVHVVHGDGTLGLPEKAPFDVIIASAGGPDVPPAWKEQLRPGGRLIMPVGTRMDQRLVRVMLDEHGNTSEENLCAVRFVALVGSAGWRNE
ncbi:protein-L-isoaspartate(D-aspartate) O-methyltransferase [Nitratireductor luteus]|uniref:protein-L-isoaspartate(D-aspartate) O-methyltransferase n=1 Tax=Nitratireductor luteus TaxID=2976980 RepID=UPI0022401BF2|nr:protein-L-isoaspartate(D-aspartate) O-methyltransferase [Nitratireductor luteus]